MSLYVLILAGGSGERFWPLSRRAKPKQLLALFSDETLLGSTLRRLEGLVPTERVLILTNADQVDGVRAVAPQLPRENIVAEPAKRDTAAAIALGAAWIAARDPSATMVVLPADHLIQDVAGFQATLRVAAAAAESSGDLVTIGIQPTWACPGFGYIEVGPRVAIPGVTDGPQTYEVATFREKPNAELAETFLRKGTFRWNAGMFVWSIPAILSAFCRHVPPLAHFIERLHAAPGDWTTLMQQLFPELPKTSIDYAILEKAQRVLMVEAAFDWDDVGNWPAVAKYLQKEESGNACNVTLQAIDSPDNIVYSDTPTTVALLGVKDLIIVRTGDALLVCHRHDSEKIKHLVAKVPAELQ
jgi:mannose-1-phosphate guanylyltransferase